MPVRINHRFMLSEIHTGLPAVFVWDTKQENNIVYFTAGENERKFLLPDCIALGFLIPDDPQIIADMKRKKELNDKLKKL